MVVDASILFPPEYPYTSSTTKNLRDNFKELYSETSNLLKLKQDDLIIDIGSNDGNLLSNFKDHHRVLGITPEEIGKLAIDRGIPTIIDYFNENVVDQILDNYGKAKIITATNVFAHMADLGKIVRSIEILLNNNGHFVLENHYLLDIIKDRQFDSIYHEHIACIMEI